MNLIIPLHKIQEKDRTRVGGKFFALAKMAARGINVPKAICISAETYAQYVGSTGLHERILLELSRKDFEDMRWEELWDASLRIRNMFLSTPMPPDIFEAIKDAVERDFPETPVVVRSSAPGEDSAKASFAGLHESYVNIRGTDSILEHVQKVWASLWSDAALLYRKELSLDLEKSTMAVVIQEIVIGDCSGVVFGQNPNDESQAVVESVYGLNQGLVDGTVAPDRWILDRTSGEVITHTPADRDQAFVTSAEGILLKALDPAKSQHPPLTEQKLAKVYGLAMETEQLFGAPQDVEWTFVDAAIYILQSRPITTISSHQVDDKRPWYLSLRRSYENLERLRSKIQDELIPAMIEAGEQLAAQNLDKLSDTALAREIERRKRIHDNWVKIYWRDFIPFAHGIRLFGQIYNDAMHPSDPYEFMDLLGATEMASLERNRLLEEMAGQIRVSPELEDELRGHRDPKIDEKFSKHLDAFIEKYGDLSCGTAQCMQGRDPIIHILLEMASRPPAPVKSKGKDIPKLESGFLSRFEGKQRGEAVQLMDLARTSYQLRDDDNIYLGRIEGQMLAAVEEAKRRVEARYGSKLENIPLSELTAALKDPAHLPKPIVQDETDTPDFKIKPRQLLGQPAGPGISKGIARVILNASDLSQFKAGEILVCDAVDPNMTFVVPLSEGIVERRGGMLIHGAIIAREYGLPCVTGVPEATRLIKTGDTITVDGFLGIVIIG
jgi:pyruvate,water dikinase